MAPRGRPRKGTTRMDAAIDAMIPFGFSQKLVRKVARDLLQEYGGEDCWYFIEQDSYEVLREALLKKAEENDPEKIKQGDHVKDVSNNETPADCGAAMDSIEDTEIPNHGQSSSNLQCTQAEGVGTSCGSNAAEEHGKNWKDIGLDQCNLRPEKSSIPSSPLMIPSPTLIPRCHRRPCYGWIESNEEDTDSDDIISFPVQTPTVKCSPIGSNSLRQRKSRWDVKPEDP